MSVAKDRQRGTWYASVRFKDSLGEGHQTTKRGFATKGEARAWEREFLAARDRNLDMTFAEFWLLYKADVYPRIKVTTRGTKDAIVEKHILPYFGAMRMSEIEPRDVVAWENGLLEKGFSGTYLRTICNQLTAAFNHAERYYGLRGNPMRVAGKVGAKRPEKEMDYWTQEEFERFAEAIEDKPESFVSFLVLYWCGLREGELLALRPADVDFGAGVIRVRRNYQRVCGKDVIQTPKTAASARDVLMPEAVAGELEDFLAAHPEIGPGDRIFEHSKHWLKHEMQRGCEASGVKPIRIHDLRHSHVSLLINLGFPAAAIGARVGHSSTEITEMYSHLFPSTQVGMVDALNRAGGHE